MRRFLPLLLSIFLMAISADGLQAQTVAAGDALRISVDMGAGAGGNTTSGAPNLSISLQLLILFTILSVVPGIIMMMTSFVRIIIVFSFLRNALAVQQPSNQILLALALFLTAFIMGPTFEKINRDALVPLRENKITFEESLNRSGDEMKTFMLRYTREKELSFFMKMNPSTLDADRPENLPLQVVIPAFMLSELKTGFQMGLLILLPFLVIDMVVSSILMSLGMMMLPPPIVALPLKLMIFVLVDGWMLIVQSIVTSFKI